MNGRKQLIHAAAIADSRGCIAAPGVVLMEDQRIIAAGRPAEIGSVPDAFALTRPNHVVMPSLVNAHTHLDLSHIGPVSFDGRFVDWIQSLRAQRRLSGPEIEDSVRQGVAMLRLGGTGLVGDIAGVGSLAPITALRQAGMPGVSFLEIFGVGRTQPAAIDRCQRLVAACPALESGVRLGLQPHAPYSCGLDMYRFAVASGLPLSTHLAETLDELAFVRDATGPLAEMLKEIGVWDDSIRGSGLHPIEHLLPILQATPFVAAHLNYLEDRHLKLPTDLPISVAYCPRASDYFGHPAAGYPSHRYRELAAAGVRVALGTDSLLCLDTPDRISILDEMRHLYRRDACDPALLLRMATINGAIALGFDPQLFNLNPGRTAGLIAVGIDRTSSVGPLDQVLAGDDAPEWVAGPFPAYDSWLLRT